MKLISVKCPDCGAALEFEEGRQTVFCSYCGTKILLHNENEFIYRNIDEAGIKQADNDRIYMMKEFELEEKKDRHHRILTFLWIFCAVISVAIGFIMVNTGPKDGDDPGYLLIMVGFIIGAYGWLSNFLGSEKEKKGKNRGRPGYARVPDQLSDYGNMHYSAVESMLRMNGFSNIRTVNLGDLRLGLFVKNGSIDSITIGGENCSTKEWYSQSTPVIITYHGFPDQTR